MTDTSTFGLGWEQIAIAVACLIVFVGAVYAAFRGRRRRARSRPVVRPAERLAATPAATPAARGAPTLGSPTSPVRAGHMAGARAEPTLVKAAPQTAPSAAGASPNAPTTDAIAQSQAEIINVIKRFKGEMDELRHANVLLERRLDETEQTIRDLREAQRLMARGPRRGAAPQTGNRAAVSETSDPPLLAENDETMARARRAINLLRDE